MRKILVFIWVLIPVAGLAYHFGPGQDRLRLDDADRALAEADAAVVRADAATRARLKDAARGEWAKAEAAFEEALAKLGPDRVPVARRVRLERAKAQMNLSRLPEARADLESLVQELKDDATAEPKLVADAREALANAQYYMTWLLRLEGVPEGEWRREIEASRQNYKLLAEAASGSGDRDAVARANENLESAVRLQRMELNDLQGLPLPSQ